MGDVFPCSFRESLKARRCLYCCLLETSNRIVQLRECSVNAPASNGQKETMGKVALRWKKKTCIHKKAKAIGVSKRD